MIYTSYFAKLKDLPENFHPLAICLSPPKWYRGPIYQSLAPNWDILNEYKQSSLSQEEKETIYRKRYQEEILNNLPNTPTLLYTMERLTGGSATSEDEHIVLLCYERPNDFCHRHESAKELTKRGVPVRELTKADLEQTIELSSFEK